MFNYSSNFTLSPSAVRLGGGGDGVQVEKEELETVSGLFSRHFPALPLIVSGR